MYVPMETKEELSPCGIATATAGVSGRKKCNDRIDGRQARNATCRGWYGIDE